MKIHGAVTINGKRYAKGSEIPWYFIYPFFLLHMLMFGLSGFFMAYAGGDGSVGFLYLHGGFAIVIYLVFYVVIFGLDEVKWMFINSALGLMGIYAQIDLILSAFGKRVGDFPFALHVIPFLYYVLYTFLLHQMVLDLSKARDDPRRKRWVDAAYVTGSIVIYGGIYLSGR